MTLRPVLTHLNGDTTWLLQIPVPHACGENHRPEYFTLLLDPWLVGMQIDVHKLFSAECHIIPPIVDSLSQLSKVDTTGGGGRVDAVVVSHEFTDHCHQPTLMELESDMLVLAPPQAAKLISSWKHFGNVHELPAFPSADGKEDIQQPLPKWLKVNWIASTGHDIGYFHSGIVISWPGQDGETEGLVYTPHGLKPESLDVLNGRVKLLALLQGLHELINPWWLGIRILNMGAHKALESINRLQPPPKYWIPTHDEAKTGFGLVSLVLKRFPWTLYDALEKKGFGEERKWKMIQLGSGEKLVLE